MIDLDTDEFSFPFSDLESTPATSAHVRIDVAALSGQGEGPATERDHYYVARGGRHVTTMLTNVPPEDIPSRAAETCYVMIVADGMGGHAEA
jgi:serine/threonine protein phosphatase PrpC